MTGKIGHMGIEANTRGLESTTLPTETSRRFFLDIHWYTPPPPYTTHHSIVYPNALTSKSFTNYCKMIFFSFCPGEHGTLIYRLSPYSAEIFLYTVDLVISARLDFREFVIFSLQLAKFNFNDR